MNPSPAPIVTRLDRLSIGIARVSIRHGSTGAAPKFREKNHAWTGFKRGHGESIYVFAHSSNGMIIYSHDPVLKSDSQKALSQIPYTVKKQKPAVLRPDYWQPMCMIRFERDRGEVGRSVFQKLREFRQLHELQWGWQADELKKLSRRERGEKIHNQKPNAIADMAAVLGGAGRGSLMWTTEPELPVLPDGENAAAEQEAQVESREEEAAAATAAASPPPPERAAVGEVATSTTPAEPEKRTKRRVAEDNPEKRLVRADIYWANDIDINWARSWSDNVVHHVGLPDGMRVKNWKTKLMVEAVEEPEEWEKTPEAEAVAEDAQGEDEAAEDKVAPEPEPKKEKKSWLGWLSGKSRSSSEDART